MYAAVDNQGTIDLSHYGLYWNGQAVSSTNKGAINVGTGQQLEFQDGTLTNTGTLALTEATLAVQDATFDDSAGKITGGWTGNLSVDNSQVTLQTDDGKLQTATALASLSATNNSTVNFGTNIELQGGRCCSRQHGQPDVWDREGAVDVREHAEPWRLPDNHSQAANDSSISNSTVTSVNGGGNLETTWDATLYATNDTIDAAVQNAGTVVVAGIVNINGALTAGAGSTIEIEEGDQGNGIGNATLTVANGFTNDGVIDLTGVGYAPYSSLLAVNKGMLVNASDGTIRSTDPTGDGGSRGLNLGNGQPGDDRDVPDGFAGSGMGRANPTRMKAQSLSEPDAHRSLNPGIGATQALLR